MKIVWLFLVLFLVASCTSEVKPSENPFSTPEKSITTLEKDIHKTRNATLYISKTYFSDYFVSQLEEATYIDPIAQKDVLKQFQQGLMNIIVERLPYGQVDYLNFANKKVIDENHVMLNYTIYYRSNENAAYIPPPISDRSFFVKIGDEWFIDIEAEYAEDGVIMSKEENEEQPPQVPSNIKNCGEEIVYSSSSYDVTMWQCFYDAYQQCMPAKIKSTGYIVKGDALTTIGWIIVAWIERDEDNSCLFHEFSYTDNLWGFKGKYYDICPSAEFKRIELWNNQSMWIYNLDYKTCKKGAKELRSHNSLISY